MEDRSRQVIAVIVAVVVVAVGVVVVVVTGRGLTVASSPPSYVVSMTMEPQEQTTGTRSSSAARTPAPPPTLTVDSGCRTGSGPAELARVPAPVTARVDRAWERIEAWLAVHAPVSAASLRPPADEQTIAETQRAVGARLPAELVASLRRHDGVTRDSVDTFTLPPFLHPLPAAGIAGDAGMMCEVLTDVGIDGNVGSWWHGQYVPIAVDHGGDSLFLAPDGRLGRHYHETGVEFDGPATYTDLLEQTADALTGTGPLAAEYRPYVADGQLGWG